MGKEQMASGARGSRIFDAEGKSKLPTLDGDYFEMLCYPTTIRSGIHCPLLTGRTANDPVIPPRIVTVILWVRIQRVEAVVLRPSDSWTVVGASFLRRVFPRSSLFPFSIPGLRGVTTRGVTTNPNRVQVLRLLGVIASPDR